MQAVIAQIAALIDSVQKRYADEWIVDVLRQRIEALERNEASMTRRIEAIETGLDMLDPIVAGLTAEAYQEDTEAMTEGLILNVAQTAKLLGVSRPTVYRMIDNGLLPAKKLSTGALSSPRTVVLSEDLHAFLAGLPSADSQPAD